MRHKRTIDRSAGVLILVVHQAITPPVDQPRVSPTLVPKTRSCMLVSERWPRFRERAEARGGLPKFVEEEFDTYLRCGILEYGLVQPHTNQRCTHAFLLSSGCFPPQIADVSSGLWPSVDFLAPASHDFRRAHCHRDTDFPKSRVMNQSVSHGGRRGQH